MKKRRDHRGNFCNKDSKDIDRDRNGVRDNREYSKKYIQKRWGVKPMKKDNLDSYHYHEASDRLYCIGNMISELILQHPVLQKHKKLRKEVEEVQSKLIIAYQMLTGLEVEAEEKEVYAVCFGNYYPPEVLELYTNDKEAIKHIENSGDDLEIVKMEIREKFKE